MLYNLYYVTVVNKTETETETETEFVCYIDRHLVYVIFDRHINLIYMIILPSQIILIPQHFFSSQLQYHECTTNDYT